MAINTYWYVTTIRSAYYAFLFGILHSDAFQLQRVFQRPAILTSSNHRVTSQVAATSIPVVAESVTFIAPPMRVYIEDTDAYGVMYNANYLRAYERAIHLISTQRPNSYYVKRCHDGKKDGDNDPLPLLNGSALDHHRWFVLAVTDHKFKGSPLLGGEFVVSGELVEKACEEGGDQVHGCVETWKLEMKSPPIDGSEEGKPTVYSTATITIASPTKSGMLHTKFHPIAAPFDESEHSTGRSTFEPFRDEFDPNLPHRMPLRNVLNLFERARTDHFGGPDRLRRMEAEDNLIWVVTTIDNCELCNLGEAGWEGSDGLNEKGNENATRSSLVQCTPGTSVTVKTTFVSRRGGLVVECNHMLLVPAWDEQSGAYRSRRLAQGTIVMMALDAKKRRPTRKLPQWLIDKMYVSGGDDA